MTRVLRQLPRMSDPNLIVGHDHFDDAGVFRLDDETALVQTLDFFPPPVDDPFTFGQIAAANALSDVYAMGGQPLTALNIVGFPDKELPAEVLGEILRGGQERVTAAGAVLVGGHSVRDIEIKYGLSVTGRVDPQKVITNAGAQPGDVLVLTKPIGVGTLTTAAKQDKIDEADLAEAIAVMTALNKDAAEVMVELGAHGATDITGFGLVGHAFEMAQGSGVGIRIDAAVVPLLARTMELAQAGVLTRAYKSCREHLGANLIADGVYETLVNVLCDAQTSGGLLISFKADVAGRAVDLMQQRGVSACVVGSVTDNAPGTVTLVGS